MEVRAKEGKRERGKGKEGGERVGEGEGGMREEKAKEGGGERGEGKDWREGN